MATVYLARLRGDRGFEQDVALKLTHAHLRESREFVTDLADEAKLAARIHHRNVVSILDVGDDPFGVFLVMEYVPGDTLAGLRRQEPPPRGVSMRIIVDALAGLHAAHELKDENGKQMGLVHRDFSPQNILVGTDGVARLADFGVAKAANRLDETRAGIVKGKIGYMSPEQARGKSVDRRSDVWAAGVVAWEALAGKRLYGGGEVGLLFRVATETPPRLRSVDSRISPKVDAAVARALAVDRDERWPTAAGFARELASSCREAGELGEVDEVAEYVQRAVGPWLSARRVAAAKVAGERKVKGSVSPAPMSEPKDMNALDHEISVLLEGTAATGASAAVTVPLIESVRPPPLGAPAPKAASHQPSEDPSLTRPWRRRLAAASVVLLGALAFAATLTLGRREPSSPGAEPRSASIADPGPVPTPSATALEPAPSAASSSPSPAADAATTRGQPNVSRAAAGAASVRVVSPPRGPSPPPPARPPPLAADPYHR
jgi:serine/threonine protein kinase